jgi:hypothetical protein
MLLEASDKQPDVGAKVQDTRRSVETSKLNREGLGYVVRTIVDENLVEYVKIASAMTEQNADSRIS